ncbi:MAG: hypothetical protein KAH95_04070 [Spirochaetales bacterium]|nr:hypothetical protein [Spirochaetales bacterium]
MNSVGILEIIAVYGSAFIILLLLITIFIVRIIRANNEKRRVKTAVLKTTEADTKKSVPRPLSESGIPNRILTSSDIVIKNKQKNVIINMENISPLKRGIMWAEILGKPGGRHRRNT